MSGDMSNAELGVAVVDSVAARGRLSGNSLEKQQTWAQNVMGERLLGYLLCLFAVVLGIAWTSEIPNTIRYAVTAGIILMLGCWVFTVLQSKSQMREHRAAQVKATISAKQSVASTK